MTWAAAAPRSFHPAVAAGAEEVGALGAEDRGREDDDARRGQVPSPVCQCSAISWAAVYSLHKVRIAGGRKKTRGAGRWPPHTHCRILDRARLDLDLKAAVR